MKAQVRSTALTSIAVLILTVVILPAAKAASGEAADSPIWLVSTFLILGFGVFVVIVLPMMASRWSRCIMKRAKAEDPSQITSLVAVVDDGGAVGEAGVLVVNRQNVVVQGRWETLFEADWSALAGVACNPLGARVAHTAAQSSGEQVLTFTDADGQAVARLIPLNPSGAGHLPEWKAGELCRAIQAARVRGAA